MHLRSPDFFDVERHPKITFSGRFSERTGATAFKGEVALTIRGVARTVPLDIRYLGAWATPFWVQLTLDAEAMLLDDLERTGAIEYYRAAESWSHDTELEDR